MRTDTRALFSAYVSQIALINSIPDATVKFAVDPVVEQRLEAKLAETSEFLQAINVIPVTQQKGEVLGLGTSRTIAGRTDTSGGTARNPTNPTDSSKTATYTCEQTNFDWSLRYALLDAWRHRPEFETLLRDSILRQQARDRIMIGWNGTSAAATTNRTTNTLLQDVNIGWLAKIRTNAPAQVFNDGALTVNDEGGNLANLKAIYVKPGVTLYDESLDNKVTAGADSLIRCGTVIELDLAQAKCRVAYGDPDSAEGDAETGWIDWLAPRAGNTKIWSPLSLGEQVLLLCPDGQLSAAVALPGLWRDIFAPPSDQAEDLITWPDGASVRYSPDTAAMQIDLPAGATLEANAPGGITLRGDVTIEGNVSVTGTIDATGDVVGGGVSLKQHRHGGVQLGSGISGEPAA